MENKNGKLFNTMGSEVAEGFTCKPKQFDASKPIMHFKTQLFYVMMKDVQRLTKEKM